MQPLQFFCVTTSPGLVQNFVACFSHAQIYLYVYANSHIWFTYSIKTTCSKLNLHLKCFLCKTGQFQHIYAICKYVTTNGNDFFKEKITEYIIKYKQTGCGHVILPVKSLDDLFIFIPLKCKHCLKWKSKTCVTRPFLVL